MSPDVTAVDWTPEALRCGGGGMGRGRVKTPRTEGGGGGTQGLGATQRGKAYIPRGGGVGRGKGDDVGGGGMAAGALQLLTRGEGGREGVYPPPVPCGA